MSHSRNKNKMMAVLGLLAALLLFSFKKKPVGDVEIGKGDFGKFGTDGDLDAIASKVSPIKSGLVKSMGSVVPKSSKSPVKTYNLKPVISTENGCCF
ncbi:hypothetical protein [Flagellimonas onchidii]|uniref:hypothetical protein n=1 Tax=Flagellimonas onchidii TaxID=2562684 RepID=UPI0010A5EACF|nr:hypothetical protein [Allomuricauda onchidii]